VSRRDILCRVNVGIAGVSTDGASENGLALARLSVHLPARRAALARERGCDLFYSTWSFLLEAADHQAPPRSQDAPVEPGFLPYIPAGIVLCAFWAGEGINRYRDIRTH
jgi:hypothetical protein